MGEPNHPCVLKIPDFEGPFDLLFHLFEKNKINIQDIPIGLITDQYIQYLKDMAKMDMEIASGFLVMASTLLHIKSRMLLPKIEVDDTEKIDPREELVRRLTEYRKFKEVSETLRSREEEWARVVYKAAEPFSREHRVEIPMDLDPVLLQDSARRVFAAYVPCIEDTTPKMSMILQKERFSIKSKIEEILGLLKKKLRMVLKDLFHPDRAGEPGAGREEMVTGFAAVLELCRAGRLKITQEAPFSDIIIYRKEENHGSKKADFHD
ncbi:MAG TPA: chromosome segregation protein ScpA [Clostridiales bacterium]|nr:chromosome segregation protein ScpA [Clostridiales bacterium]